MILTQAKLLEAGIHPDKSGWNYEQLKLLGVPVPLAHGWFHTLTASQPYVSDATWTKVLAIKGMTGQAARRVLQSIPPTITPLGTCPHCGQPLPKPQEPPPRPQDDPDFSPIDLL